MLASLTIENWMSFRNPVTFSMMASGERQHGERVPTLKKYQARILPVSAIYGGNASGKTNFFRALRFMQKMVVDGTKPDNPIPVEPFRLDKRSASQPSKFCIIVLIDDVLYEYAFSATHQAIEEEKLSVITASSEKVLFHRRKNNAEFGTTAGKKDFLRFAFQGTRNNQLFLTNSVSQNVNDFRPVYDWFANTLELIAPDSRFNNLEQFLDEDHPMYATMNETLSSLDTGISRIGGETVAFQDIPVPEVMKAKVRDELKEGTTVKLLGPNNERYCVSKRKGELIAKKIVSFHIRSDGAEEKFDIQKESDGTRRIIDLLPAFLDLSAAKSNKVYVIDEVERSLHTHMIRRLLEMYLEHCSKETRAQLLLTTHDVMLMDQKLLRRDEMWVAERNGAGITKLISFCEYKDIRYDKDIRKSYLQGRLGGIPFITA